MIRWKINKTVKFNEDYLLEEMDILLYKSKHNTNKLDKLLMEERLTMNETRHFEYGYYKMPEKDE